MSVAAEKSVQITIHLESVLADRLDSVAKRFSRRGTKLSRLDAARMAIVEGLPRLEIERRLKTRA